MQALAVIEALNKGVFDFAPTPSQQEKDKVSQEFQSGFLPCDFEVTEDFRKAYTKFRRFAEKKDPMMIINYKRYGKYIQNHYYDFSDDQRYAIFELDMMLNLIHNAGEYHFLCPLFGYKEDAATRVVCNSPFRQEV